MSLNNANRKMIAAFATMIFAVAVVPCCSLFADEAVPKKSPDESSGKASTRPGKDPKKVEPSKQLFSGKVVLLQEALKRRDVDVADEMKLQVVLETKSGELIPIAADWRGRAFFQDKKLRDRQVEIVGYRRPGIPYLQALAVYFFNSKGEREIFDYWCDICAIPMYEIKDCECCQGPSRHRYRQAELPDYLFLKGSSGKKQAIDETLTPKLPGKKQLPSEKKSAP
jgi:hypothetical protein